MNDELKEIGKQLIEILDKYPNRQKEILFYILGEDTIREIITKPTYEELEQKVKQLETNRDEVIRYIEKESAYLNDDEYELLNKKEILSILERGKE